MPSTRWNGATCCGLSSSCRRRGSPEPQRCNRSPASSSTTRGAIERFIPELFGRRLTAPRGPSCGWVPIRRGCRGSPTGATSRRRPGPLPYLLKVLAAAQPLSLQTHPSAEQAQAGYQAGRYPGPLPEARAAVCADGVRGVLRRPPDRRDDRPPRGGGAAPLRRGVREHRRRRHDRRPAARARSTSARSSRRAPGAAGPRRAG